MRILSQGGPYHTLLIQCVDISLLWPFFLPRMLFLGKRFDPYDFVKDLAVLVLKLCKKTKEK